MRDVILFRVYSQIIAKQNLPDSIRNDLMSYVGCISGAIQLDQYKDLIGSAGLRGDPPRSSPLKFH